MHTDHDSFALRCGAILERITRALAVALWIAFLAVQIARLAGWLA